MLRLHRMAEPPPRALLQSSTPALFAQVEQMLVRTAFELCETVPHGVPTAGQPALAVALRRAAMLATVGNDPWHMSRASGRAQLA